MKACKRFQQLTTRLAQRHGIDIHAPGAYLKLENEPYMPLVVENLDGYRVSVAHYYEQNGDLLADPDVVFFVGYGEWVPIEITQPPVYVPGIGGHHGYARYAELERGEDGRPRIARINRKGQADLARFVEGTWALNIEAQRWLEQGQIPEEE